MFIVAEERIFPATHRILLPTGEWEPLHEHDWLLKIYIRSKELDDKQLVIDFLDLQRYMDEALAPYIGKDIGEQPPFNEGISPTTEYFAWVLYQSLAPKIDDERIQLYKVELREAPTSWGIYEVA